MTYQESEAADGINFLGQQAFETAKASGFHDNGVDRGVEATLARIALVHEELSEAVQEYRKLDPDMDHFVEEMADACIRLFHMAIVHDVDLGQAILDKMEKNRNRPRMHGKRI